MLICRKHKTELDFELSPTGATCSNEDGEIEFKCYISDVFCYECIKQEKEKVINDENSKTNGNHG
jgi:hypothetical protein